MGDVKFEMKRLLKTPERVRTQVSGGLERGSKENK